MVFSMKNDWKRVFAFDQHSESTAMTRWIGAVFLIFVWGLSIAPAQAGPCADGIAQFELAVRQSAGSPGAGPFLRQSISAQLDRQPTPASVRRAQKRAHAQFAATLARAKRLDARDDRAGCMRALEAAEDMYNLQ